MKKRIKPIVLFHPYVSEKARKAVNETLKTRWIGQGPKVDEFEQAFMEKFGVRNSLAVNSGTSALELAYELLGLKAGDQVITTPFTCTATNIPLLRRGVELIWADIDPVTMNISRKSIMNKITYKTRAIINVNMGGIKSNIGRFDIPVVADSAQALGIFNGDFVINSFQAIKHVTTGDGGMLTVRNQDLYRRAKLLRWFGIDREQKKKDGWQAYKHREMTFDIEVAGFKYQPTDIMASMGIAHLSEYNKIIKQREDIFNVYRNGLKDIPGIRMIDGPENVYWTAGVIVDSDRDSLAAKLKEYKIESNTIQVRNDIYKIFGGIRRNLDNMNFLEDKYLYIPLHNRMSVDDAQYIVDVIKGGW